MKPPIDGFNLALYPAGPVTQYFGENERLYRLWGLKGHNGIDLVKPHGSPLYAVEDGEIVGVKHDAGGFGKHLKLLSADHEWTYGHCSEILVKIGEKVRAGQKIALMGNTGFVVSGSTPYWKNNPYAGTHLHLGVRKIKRSKTGWSYPGSTTRFDIVDYENGYKGAFDPAPLLSTIGYIEPEVTRRYKMLTVISLLNTIIRSYEK
jgi:murein DD-endopeptidase MepM/ murein hydrolase activator NlpD